MSLARIALRIAAVEAIKGRTLVGEHVLDTPNGALDVQADGELRIGIDEKPFVAVFTDAGSADDITGRSLIENGSCVLVIEAGISQAMTELNKETGTTTLLGIGIPASDAGFEFHLDVVQRQVMDALNDPDNAWAEIYRSLHYRVTKIEVGGKRNTDDGQRLAGHQTRITLDLIQDPVRGEPIEPDSPLGMFFAAMQASGDAIYQAQATTMQGLVGGNDPDWKVLQRRHGMTAAELLALGRGPVAQDEPRETPEFTTGAYEVEGVGTGEVSG
ncbi:hypothetical protein [Tianweitania sediminis]|uniref:Uncharacterized protein n=1 Tax=Tianweitania sediminis TaxID=1502156 RepID=A0A8J7UL87_9HYPH|nr:hypothetical protein [Tianweitania sediminis]MBP0440685.1 hypothetical protein [Tianweitania sediminis]